MTTDLEMMKAMASLYRKKAAVMKALEGGIVKGGTNKHFDYKFMTASTIKHMVGQLFAEHGIVLKMSGVATENAVSAVEVKDYQTKEVRMKEVPILRIQFSICLCDVDTGAVDESFWFGEAGASDDKAASKAATSALKYFLISNLLIADKEEDAQDTDADKPRKRETQQPQRDVSTPSKLREPNNTGQHIAAVLPNYQRFMSDSDFQAMRDALRQGVKSESVRFASETAAVQHIEKTYAKTIDMDALRAARKEAEMPS